MKNIVKNDLFDYGLKIFQYEEYFKFSVDSILLAEYTKITNKTKSILDLCSGNASIALILSTRTNALIDSFEIQTEIYNLAVQSINYNKLENQITIYNDDVKNIKNYIGNKKYDIITCNPPYFKIESDEHINNLEPLAIARHELKINLEEIFKISSELLDDKGEFFLVHRVSRLDEIIILGNKYKLNVKNIEFIKTKDTNKPYIVLVRCIKNSKLGVKINNPKSIENVITYKGFFKEDL